MRTRLGLVSALTAVGLLSACTSDTDGGLQPETAPGEASSSGPSVSASPSAPASPSHSAGGRTEKAGDEPSKQPSRSRTPPPRPVSVEALDASEHRGDRLRIGAVREQTADYTSYDVAYRSISIDPRGEKEILRITGVLNVPTGRGPFPAVVLAHGYIDPAIYVRGQGMTRERGYLASRGYIALHVDYRNHAESDDAPDGESDLRLGYAADVVNAVKALQASDDVPVDDDRIGLFGRSMGGGVVQKTLIAEPGLVGAASAWASVSSREGENYNQFQRSDPEDAGLRSVIERRYGLPEDNPEFWSGVSARPYFDRITEPVLLVHGRYDDTCPPRWASATQRAMRQAGVDSQLEWYEDGHAFGPAFFAAMNRTVQFFDARLPA